MGLLDQVIGSVLNSRTSGQTGGFGGSAGGMGGPFGGGMGGTSSPLVMALMALLGSGALGGRGGGSLGGLLGGLTGGAAGRGGGLGDLLERFQRNGHGDTFQSWIGPGENRPIAPRELNEALGQDTVDDLSLRTGMPQNDLLQQLAQVLPGVVNGVTPHGRMPARDEVANW